MSRLRIYLADLTHMGLGVATEAFPLNVGLVASYVLKKFGKEIEVSLFKYPQQLAEALTDRPPHILGCSNYTWNSRLSMSFLEMAKSIDPKILTVFGGTNYPFDAENQKKFLAQRPCLDLHIFYEGETSFSNVIERFLSVTRPDEFFSEPIAGCQFLDKKTGEFCSGPPVPRLLQLDAIPSPYATGLLDPFFDGKLTPLLETARGCPFTCNFCNAGGAYFTKVNLFSDDYVREEWAYVARKASRVGVSHTALADNNFGMLPRDQKSAELMRELQDRYGWPRTVTAWTGKNSRQRVIEVTRILGDTLSISMAVQSMDAAVLRNIARSNIRLDDYRAVAEELNTQGRPQVAEIIAPLPGETWESHIRGVSELLDTHVSTIIVHTLQMLHGTPYKDDAAYIQRHEFLCKYRLVPYDFGTYGGRPIFDTEEVAVATNTFSFEDYVRSRKLLFLIVLCYNNTVFEPLKKFIRSLGLKLSDWVQFLFHESPQFPQSVKAIWESFTADTAGELWKTEEELVRFYSQPENYQRLVEGDIGGNVLFKHHAWMMSQAGGEWVETVFETSERFLKERELPTAQTVPQELAELKRFVACRISDAFDFTGDNRVLNDPFLFDLPAWLKAEPADPLSRYRCSKPRQVLFFFQEEQIRFKREASVRYGSNRSGTIKLIQRIGGIQRFLRNVSYESSNVPCHDSTE